MNDIRCDDCDFNKKIATYDNEYIYLKCTNNNPKCKHCERIKKIRICELVKSSTDYKV